MAEAITDTATEQAWHKKYAVELNHFVWTLLGKADRTFEEDAAMLHAAHASHVHWEATGTAVSTRGEWLISHVYAVLNRSEAALYHARRCLDLCQEHNVRDFDIAYGYEAMARAYALSGQREDCEKYLALAQEAGERIQDSEDREIFLGDFTGGPWHGLR
jgi:hypothetical protein